MFVFEKIILPSATTPDFRAIDKGQKPPLFERGQWPAKWIHDPTDDFTAPHFLFFRKAFKLEERMQFRVHVTADERYVLWIDGVRLAEGPERGDPDTWYFDSYDITLEAGEHTISCRVNALGYAAPRAQMSLRPGLLFCPESPEALELLGTGVAEWEVTRLKGYTFTTPFENEAFSVGYNCTHDAREMKHGIEPGSGSDWSTAQSGLSGALPDQRNRYPTTHLLHPAILEARLRTPHGWGRLRGLQNLQTKVSKTAPRTYSEETIDRELAAQVEELLNNATPLTLPANTHLRILMDLEDYFGADYGVQFKGAPGSSVTIQFAESLFVDTDFKNKGQRDQVTGKYFFGIGDTFIGNGADDARLYESIFWRSGRFVEISFETCGESMTVDALNLLRVGYPIQWQYNFESSDPTLNSVFPLAERTITASADDSLMDGPYYEQMLWSGDLTQSSLTQYVASKDSRLIRKAIHSFDASRLSDGLTCARWPARDRMIIPTYSLYWIDLIYHYSFWRTDSRTVAACMPGIRGVIEAFLKMKNADGLIEIKKGWNFVDWVKEWEMGMPPGADGGVSSTINWHFVNTLHKAATLEELFEEFELARRYRRFAAEIAEELKSRLWDADRGLFKDTPGGQTYSEHSQALAILSGHLTGEQLERISSFAEQAISKATISFSHFVFDALFKLGRPAVFFERLESWKAYPAQGFLTLPEEPEPSRSDCHAWGVHPLYHLQASVLGIQPTEPSFKRVMIQPQLGSLTWARGEIPHPNGSIVVKVETQDKRLTATVELPEGVTGQLSLNNETHELQPGSQSFG